MGRYTGKPLRFHYTTLQEQYPTSLSWIEAIAIIAQSLHPFPDSYQKRLRY
ncbi:hypothetical protein [Allocoleopsis sp.]|uniref:hypothetical protein n=1 Tax=Allocoleopsis sp. TaxID=3088169 RepID=UPI002FD53B14